MEIPLPPSSDDIYSAGFDKNLNRGDSSTLPTTLVYDSVDGITQAQAVQFGSLVAGSQNSIFVVDPAKGLWLGNAKFESAPFRVNMNGDVSATSVSISGVLLASQASFGGSGADGAFSQTTAVTTTINAVGAKFIEKNYTTFNMTSGTYTISNPHANGSILIIKTTGVFTHTGGNIDVAQMGGIAGTGGAGAGGGGGAAGTDANAGTATVTRNGGGTGGQGGRNGAVTRNGGTAGTSNFLEMNILGKCMKVSCGAGAGGGGGGFQAGVDGGNGGRGGGGVIIECKGALNITSTINAAGTTGSNGANAGAGAGSGAGGGGGGGDILVAYNSLTANTATLTVSAGSGGTGGTGTSDSGGGGGAGGAGSAASAASGSPNTTSAGGAGGAGGNGQSLVVLNNQFP